jgi:hypothetical protein
MNIVVLKVIKISFKGKKHTEEYKERMRKISSGRRHLDETKQKIRESKIGKYKGENSPLFGIPKSDLHKQHLSESRKGKCVGKDHPMYGKHWSDEIKEKQRKAKIGKYNGERNPFYGKHHSEETKEKISKANIGKPSPFKGKHHSDEQKQKQSEAMKGKYKGETNPFYGKTHSEETRKKIKDWNKLHIDEKSKKMSGKNNPMFGIGVDHPWFGKTHSMETRIKLSMSHQGINNVEHWNGFSKEQKYCEKWNENLRQRIRLYFGNKSTLSGKTKEDNNGRNLSCHHVYYQKKACCEWDNDVNGYYAIIDGEKYYINGDPNKFVLLTTSENTLVNKNKLYYIKLFENLIQNNYNNKCYYTQDEYKSIINNNYFLNQTSYKSCPK